jgi:hypothetical protein
MASRDLMLNLNTRLEPIREKFGFHLYRWSAGILEQQALDEASLFWKVPSRMIRNLHQLLKIENANDLRFFLILHGCHHQRVLSQLGQEIPSHEEEVAMLKRCIDPPEQDVRRSGLLPLSAPMSRLNKRKLNSAIRARLSRFFNEDFDPSLPNERDYEARNGAWQIIARIDTRASCSQVEIEFDIRLGMGPLSLARQVSLHGVFGIGPSGWDLAKPGDEEEIAQLVEEYCQFMVPALSSLVKELDPGISIEEVSKAEQEWAQWLKLIRAERASRRSRHQQGR